MEYYVIVDSHNHKQITIPSQFDKDFIDAAVFCFNAPVII